MVWVPSCCELFIMRYLSKILCFSSCFLLVFGSMSSKSYSQSSLPEKVNSDSYGDTGQNDLGSNLNLLKKKEEIKNGGETLLRRGQNEKIAQIIDNTLPIIEKLCNMCGVDRVSKMKDFRGELAFIADKLAVFLGDAVTEISREEKRCLGSLLEWYVENSDKIEPHIYKFLILSSDDIPSSNSQPNYKSFSVYDTLTQYFKRQNLKTYISIADCVAQAAKIPCPTSEEKKNKFVLMQWFQDNLSAVECFFPYVEITEDV